MNKNIKNEDMIVEVECENVEGVVEETKMDKVKKTVKKWVKPVAIGLAAAGTIAGGIYILVRESKGKSADVDGYEDSDDFPIDMVESYEEDDCE